MAGARITVPEGGLSFFDHRPELFAAFNRYYGTLWTDGAVDEATKEVGRLRNARVTGCNICKNLRFAGARDGGLTEDLVDEIVDGYAESELPDRYKLVIRYADVLITDPKAMTDDLRAALLDGVHPGRDRRAHRHRSPPRWGSRRPRSRSGPRRRCRSWSSPPPRPPARSPNLCPDSPVHLELSAEQRALQLEVRSYFASLMTPERRASLGAMEAGGAAYRDVVRQMGKDGWLGVGWPTEYGGQGRTPLEQLIFYDEAQRAGVPIPLVTLNTVGPTLMRFGSDEQRASFLPRILAGELHFAIGYTRARRGHRPRVAAHARGARRRRVRGERPEDLHHRRPRRRLGVAGVPDRHGGAEAQGHLDPARRHQESRVQAHADPPARRWLHEHHVLRRRARARVLPRRQRERGLEDDHDAAQPRARRARAGRADRSPPAFGAALGAGDQPRRWARA